MLTIYHNPRCSKSRAGLKYLESRTTDYEIRKYLTDPLSREELKKLLTKLNKKPHEIVRTQEKYYKENLKGKNFTDEEWITIITENPRLIQRPIVEAQYKAVIANPPENIDEFFKYI
jgi:arsenate reductase (glutaredoxin)